MVSGVGKVRRPLFVSRPRFSTRPVTIFSVSDQEQLVVQIIFTRSSKTVGDRSMRPAPCLGIQSKSGLEVIAAEKTLKSSSKRKICLTSLSPRLDSVLLSLRLVFTCNWRFRALIWTVTGGGGGGGHNLGRFHPSPTRGKGQNTAP